MNIIINLTIKYYTKWKMRALIYAAVRPNTRLKQSTLPKPIMAQPHRIQGPISRPTITQGPHYHFQKRQKSLRQGPKWERAENGEVRRGGVAAELRRGASAGEREALWSSMEEQEFRRLLDLFPVVRSRDYMVNSLSPPIFTRFTRPTCCVSYHRCL